MKYDHIKRIGDLFIASLAIVFLLPLFVVTAIIIRLESPGAALFHQKRYGKDKQPFTVYKFRTMSAQAPNNMPTNDFHDAHTYITQFGRIIRKLSIDELPQLINVLQGHMSLVGPRPVVLSETSLINERDKYGANAVKPGITGWAQVNGLRGDTSINERTKFDLWYIEHWNLLLDIKILVRTLWQIFNGRGNRRDELAEENTAEPAIGD